MIIYKYIIIIIVYLLLVIKKNLICMRCILFFLVVIMFPFTKYKKTHNTAMNEIIIVCYCCFLNINSYYKCIKSYHRCNNNCYFVIKSFLNIIPFDLFKKVLTIS